MTVAYSSCIVKLYWPWESKLKILGTYSTYILRQETLLHTKLLTKLLLYKQQIWDGVPCNYRTRGGQKLLTLGFLLVSHQVYCGECAGTLWACWAALVHHKLVIYVKYIHNFAIISAQTAYFLFESDSKVQ